jgi:hypothetical protein
MILTPFSPRRPLLPRYAECTCGEYRKAALRRAPIDGVVKCQNCAPRHDANRGTCFVCKGASLPLEDNHIGFRAACDLTQPFCLNCHDVFSWKTYFLAREAKKRVITPQLQAYYLEQGKAVIALMTEELESS